MLFPIFECNVRDMVIASVCPFVTFSCDLNSYILYPRWWIAYNP